MGRQTSTVATGDDFSSGQYQWYVVTTLMVGYLFAFLDRTMIGLMVQPIQADLQISDTQMSLLMGLAFTLLYTIAGLPSGYLADRFNRVRLIKFGAIIWCAMTAACGLSTSFWQLFAARVMVGLGEATLTPSANSLIGDYFKPEKAGKAVSVFNLGMASGVGLSLILGGQLINWITNNNSFEWPLINDFAPWQIVFILLGLSGGIFLIMLSFVKEPPRTGRASDTEMWTLRQTGSYFAGHIKFYGALCVCMSAVSILSFAALSWIPTYFIRIHGWTPAEAGLSFGMASLGSSIIGIVLCGWWIDFRRGRGEVDAAWRVMMIGILVLMPGYFIATLFDNPTITLICLVVGVFGASLAAIASPTIIITASPNEARGTSIAIVGLAVNIFGASVGPTAVALLNDYYFEDPNAIGWSIAIVSLAGYCIAVGAAFYGAAHYRNRVQQPQMTSPS